ELAIVTAYGAAFSKEVYDELLAEGRTEAEKFIAAAADLLTEQGVTVQKQILEGQAATAIAEAAGRNDVIVMTSHGHGGIRRWFLGSTATKLINHPNLAVLLVPAVAPDESPADERGT
ncbi:MAG: universal stress protein, partial [Thermomicrobiales bacterium]|nr:universal stress protein [Thermomicrobiales bacterium]